MKLQCQLISACLKEICKLFFLQFHSSKIEDGNIVFKNQDMYVDSV